MSTSLTYVYARVGDARVPPAPPLHVVELVDDKAERAAGDPGDVDRPAAGERRLRLSRKRHRARDEREEKKPSHSCATSFRPSGRGQSGPCRPYRSAVQKTSSFSDECETFSRGSSRAGGGSS